MSLRRTLCVFLASCAIGGSAAGQTVRADPRVASALELARTWLEAQRAYQRIPGISAAIVHDQRPNWGQVCIMYYDPKLAGLSFFSL